MEWFDFFMGFAACLLLQLMSALFLIALLVRGNNVMEEEPECIHVASPDVGTTPYDIAQRVKRLLNQTWEQDEAGNRLDGPGELSAADLLDRLNEMEEDIDYALGLGGRRKADKKPTSDERFKTLEDMSQEFKRLSEMAVNPEDVQPIRVSRMQFSQWHLDIQDSLRTIRGSVDG